ncbi:UDP-glucose 4-epimerase [compost metagenome]
MDYLVTGGASTAFNLGNGQGFSVQEVIDTARRVTGQAISVSDAPRRAGDPPRLVADPQRAYSLLGWQPQFASLEQIVTHAWSWEKKHPWQ